MANPTIEKVKEDLKSWLDPNIVVEHIAGQTWVVRAIDPGMNADVKEALLECDTILSHISSSRTTGWDVFFKV